MIEARRDPEATKKRNFLDPRSYVTLGGKTYLFGADVEPLRSECYRRSMGYCEMRLSDGQRCNRPIDWQASTFLGQMQMHHDPPLSRGGWDHLDGVLASCHRCHVLAHGRVIGGRK